jgi:hypothetical protein
MRRYRIDMLQANWTPLHWGDGFDTFSQADDAGQRFLKYPGINGYRVWDSKLATCVVSVENVGTRWEG